MMGRNPHVLEALTRLITYLRITRAHAEYVLFGSTVMYLHGLRDEVGDVDVFVTKRVWDELALTWTQIEPRAGDPPYLRLDGHGDVPVHAFYDWTKRDSAWMDVGRCFALAQTVRGWRCIPLSEVAHHKRSAWLAWEGPPDAQVKHTRDLAVLEAQGIVPVSQLPRPPITDPTGGRRG